jgi:transcriptional regulator with XRE-family HTH domain
MNKNEKEKLIYNRIKAVLAEKNVKNNRLAAYLKVSPGTVSDWCTNTNQPSVQQLFHIAELLKVSPRVLLEEEKRVREELEQLPMAVPDKKNVRRKKK